MPVHAIRVETSKTSKGIPIETVLSTLVASRKTVLDDEADDRLTPIDPTETEPLDEAYRAGLWRFDSDEEDVDDLLDAFEAVLSGTAKWYRLRYHLCDHDLPAEERTGGCEWDDAKTRSGGPVPPELA